MKNSIERIKAAGHRQALVYATYEAIETAKKYLAHAYGRGERIRAALMDAEEAIKRAHEFLNESEKDF